MVTARPIAICGRDSAVVLRAAVPGESVVALVFGVALIVGADGVEQEHGDFEVEQVRHREQHRRCLELSLVIGHLRIVRGPGPRGRPPATI